MDIRALPVGQGLTWFKQAIDLGGKNPRAVFGAALLLIGALYAAAMVLALALATLVMGGQTADAGSGPGLTMAMWVALPLMLLVMLLVPILLGGLMHVIREAEAGRPVRARDVFMPVREPRGRRLALLGLLQVALAAVGAALMMAVAGADYWRDYVAAMQSAMHGGVPAQMPQPRNAGLLFLVQLVFNYFSYAMMLFAIPLMLFSGSGFVEALRDSLRAAVRNVGANLLAGLLFIGALLVASLVVLLVGGLASMVGSFIHQALGGLLLLVVMLGFASVVLVVVAGAAYLAWRDTFGEGALPPPPAADSRHGIEV